jgi:hypothetical protein
MATEPKRINKLSLLCLRLALPSGLDYAVLLAFSKADSLCD